MRRVTQSVVGANGVVSTELSSCFSALWLSAAPAALLSTQTRSPTGLGGPDLRARVTL